MKKDIIFTPILLLVFAALALLDATGMAAHIIISIVGIMVLGAYTAATRKFWKIPALEILMRVCYGIALISGVVLMNVSGIAAIAIAHKATGTLFAVLLVVLFVLKLRAKKA